jgi:hypothetical protein
MRGAGEAWTQFVDNGGLWIAAAVVCGIVLIGLIVWAIGTYGRLGLIQGVLNAEVGKSTGFRAVASEAWPIYGQALGLNFLLGILPLAVGILLVVIFGAVGLVTMGLGLLCVIPLACLLIPIGIAYTVYIEVANTALVVSRRGIGEAISTAWEVLRSNFGPYAGMTLILYLGGLVVAVIMAAPILAAAVPFVAMGVSGNLRDLWPWIIALIVVAVPVYLLLSGVLRTYLQAAWTLTYLELKPGAAVTVTAPKAPRSPAKAKTTRTTRSTKAK